MANPKQRGGGNRQGSGNNNQRRRRGRNAGGNQGGGGGHSAPRGPQIVPLGDSLFEAVFDHGNDGYGIWFDGQVREDPIYRQYWKGGRGIYVQLSEDRIVITKHLPKDADDDAVDDVLEDAPEQGNSIDDPDIRPTSVYAGETSKLFGDSDEDEDDESDDDEDSDDSDDEPEAEAKPAPRKRTTRRRVVIADDDSDD